MPGSLCVGAQLAGLQVLPAMGAFYWGRLITVEAPGHPRHPSSTKLVAVVKWGVWSSWLLKDSKRGKQLTCLFHLALIIKHQKVMILGKKTVTVIFFANLLTFPSLIIVIT